ncbi:hypothetical protein B9T19_02770 [Ignatzschineria sp. F8392]|uniref:DUF3800 domain-containing protein n=1 Tax=Ignatzschineria sp. F8392 TaxID=1980117 RepID=UPI000B97F2A6|nr:DUF3800 domain-containing protein [Ignatzschineria sp. F8392]OYQ81607.1 hypothetical protein B9T19_02770 [Ignatzschineria sp. F8392]
MHFYIDESGNTGKDLMNKNQPIFYYGMVVSSVDLEKHRTHFVEEIKKCTNKDTIHAKDLSGEILTELIGIVSSFMDENELKFYSYLCVKKDYIIIQFFDQLFGLNPFNHEFPKCDLCNQLQNPETRAVLLYLLKESMDDTQLADILTARHHRNVSLPSSAQFITRDFFG